MTFAPRVSEDTTTIKSEGYSVRVAVESGNPLFACKDILSLCGYKCASDVAKKFCDNDSLPGTVKKVAYPVVGKRGMRRILMYFADSDAARQMIATSNISGDARKWLESSVLTYGKSSDDYGFDEDREEQSSEQTAPKEPVEYDNLKDGIEPRARSMNAATVVMNVGIGMVTTPNGANGETSARSSRSL